MKKHTSLFTVCLIVLLLGVTQLQAQESTEELSIEAANPMANLMSFPFQNNLNMNGSSGNLVG